MAKNRRLLWVKMGLVAAVVPIVIQAYEFGPPPGVTGAPGDNPTGCIQAGCHSGTPNSGPGSVKVSLPNGVTTYTPGGAAISITVLITDASSKSYGFEMTARSGADGLTQAGDFSTTDGNTQVVCPDDFVKQNGKLCSKNLPIEYIEHTDEGWSNSVRSTTGSFTYTFNWTPPATAVGNVTMYIAANCGSGAVLVGSTRAYLSSLVLTPVASGTSGPVISNVLDAASGRSAIVPGAWVAIYGSGFGTASRAWTAADFNGSNLPASLSGVSVKFGTLPAAVYYVSPGQIDVQAPAGISGTVPVVVSVAGTSSAATSSPLFNAAIAQNAPALFTYPGGSNIFPAAQNASFVTLGDPAVTPGTVKAVPGQPAILYVNGLSASPAGTLIGMTISYSDAVTVTIGSNAANVTYAGLIAAGLYQVNAVVPGGLAPGNYPITVSANGQTSQPGVLLPVGQ